MNEPIFSNTRTYWRIQSRDAVCSELWWPIGYECDSLAQAQGEFKYYNERKYSPSHELRLIRVETETKEYVENV